MYELLIKMFRKQLKLMLCHFNQFNNKITLWCEIFYEIENYMCMITGVNVSEMIYVTNNYKRLAIFAISINIVLIELL